MPSAQTVGSKNTTTSRFSQLQWQLTDSKEKTDKLTHRSRRSALIHLTFDNRPPIYQRHNKKRAYMRNAQELEYQDSDIRTILQNTKTIALVGASNKAHRASYRVMAFLQSKQYRVIPVNPRLAGGKLLGEPVYASLAEIPDAIDMVDIFRNSEAAGLISEEAIRVSPKVIWMQLGVINTKAAQKAEKTGIQVIMDRCPKIEYVRVGM